MHLTSVTEQPFKMTSIEKVRLPILLILCALSFLLNATFLLIVCKSWKLVKRRRITYHVTNLAFSDFMVGASSFCSFTLMAVAGRETPSSLAFYKIAWMSTLTSLQAVCLMAIERAVCLQKPHTWHQILPLKRILLVMAGNWVFALPLTILMHFYKHTMMFVFLVLVTICLSVTSVLYVNMYVKIRKSNKVHDEVVQEGSSAACLGRSSVMRIVRIKLWRQGDFTNDNGVCLLDIDHQFHR